MNNIKAGINLMGGVITATLTYFLGGMDLILSILLAVIVIDYATGLINAICKGELSSEVGYKGIAKKIGILAVVALAHLIGLLTGVMGIRSLAIGFYIANEGISILENVGSLGIPFPKKLINILKQLKDDSDPE